MQIPETGSNIGWQVFSKPGHPEKEAHTHVADQYLIFPGEGLPDLFSSFEDGIDFHMSDEMKQQVITRPIMVFLPKNMSHTPLNFLKLSKPVFFPVF